MYQLRKDVDKLLDAVERLNFVTSYSTDDPKILATVEELNDIVTDFANRYYDKSEVYSKEEADDKFPSLSDIPSSTSDLTNDGEGGEPFIVNKEDIEFSDEFKQVLIDGNVPIQYSSSLQGVLYHIINSL